ncbi:MAG: hypothetical protein SGILL_008929 [Bacillariaceae sp.]
MVDANDNHGDYDSIADDDSSDGPPPLIFREFNIIASSDRPLPHDPPSINAAVIQTVLKSKQVLEFLSHSDEVSLWAAIGDAPIGFSPMTILLTRLDPHIDHGPPLFDYNAMREFLQPTPTQNDSDVDSDYDDMPPLEAAV